MAIHKKRFAVLGFGIEGVSTVRYLLKQGEDVSVLDKKKEEEFNSKEIETLKNKGVTFELGSEYLAKLEEYDVIVRSPGIQLSTSEIQQAKKKGVEVTSHTKLFFDVCPCPIIGVTGTKGKGTTSSLIYAMLKNEGIDAYLGGNIGDPPLDFLEKLTPTSRVVLELSSFQLMDLEKSPHIAVILMITSEHLDYHPTTEEYVDAKRNIVRFQSDVDFAVINRDYPASHESDIHTNAQVFQVSRERDVYENGCFVRDGFIVIRKNGIDEEIINTSEILLPGGHNLENVCAAVMVAKLEGVSHAAIKSVLKSFKGLEHRLELVDQVFGVKYYDDSFSTTPETAIAAIEAFKESEILILGGSSKGSNFAELGQVISNAENIKAIIGIGVEWPRIKESLKINDLRLKIIEGLKNMKEIVHTAAELAEEGDVVILSPACASFDMFKNYKDRGEQFKREVRQLALH